MTKVAETLSHIAWANTLEELSVIFNPECNLAIWQRQPNKAITAFLMKHSHEDIHICKVLPASAVERALRRGLKAFEDDAGKEQLIADITQIANFFTELTDASELHLYLETIRTDQCRKFHRDFYPLRLLCTYIGKGTEYLENDNVNREGKTNDEIVRDWQKVRRLNAFDVGILKGEAPGNEGNAIFHRSPEIESTNDFRVLLRIDV
jgi:hypothetical protein